MKKSTKNKDPKVSKFLKRITKDFKDTDCKQVSIKIK